MNEPGDGLKFWVCLDQKESPSSQQFVYLLQTPQLQTKQANKEIALDLFQPVFRVEVEKQVTKLTPSIYPPFVYTGDI